MKLRSGKKGKKREGNKTTEAYFMLQDSKSDAGAYTKAMRVRLA
jgi:hypothetical protein